jgi:hypothetical protein
MSDIFLKSNKKLYKLMISLRNSLTINTEKILYASEHGSRTDLTQSQCSSRCRFSKFWNHFTLLGEYFMPNYIKKKGMIISRSTFKRSYKMQVMSRWIKMLPFKVTFIFNSRVIDISQAHRVLRLWDTFHIPKVIVQAELQYKHISCLSK